MNSKTIIAVLTAVGTIIKVVIDVLDSDKK